MKFVVCPICKGEKAQILVVPDITAMDEAIYNHARLNHIPQDFGGVVTSLVEQLLLVRVGRWKGRAKRK